MTRKRKHTISPRPAGGNLPERKTRKISLSLFSEFLKRPSWKIRFARGFSRHGDGAPEELRDKKYEIAALRDRRIVRDARVLFY